MGIAIIQETAINPELVRIETAGCGVIAITQQEYVVSAAAIEHIVYRRAEEDIVGSAGATRIVVAEIDTRQVLTAA